MRYLLIALLVISGCTMSPAKSDNLYEQAHAAVTLAAWTSGLKEGSGPIVPPSPNSKCTNCNGTGKVGDGRVFVDCVVCGGDGIADASAGIQIVAWQGLDDETISKIAMTTADEVDARLSNKNAPQEPTPVEASAKSVLETPYSIVVIYSTDSCPACEQWLAAEKSKLEEAGWSVEKREATPGVTVPYFEIIRDGEVIGKATGYLTMKNLRQILEESQ